MVKQQQNGPQTPQTPKNRSRKPRRGNSAVAVAYLRVSTEDQDLGPEAQAAAIAAWAERERVSIVATFADKVSGAAELEARPGLIAALDAISFHQAGILVAAKRDRLARSVLLAATIEQLAERIGSKVVTADGVGLGDGPEAELMRTMMDAFAAYERQLIRARTSAALRAKIARGEPAGGMAPRGQRIVWGSEYTDGKGVRRREALRLERDPEELRAAARIAELREQKLSFTAIIERLEAEGFHPRGKRWHRATVFNLAKLGGRVE